MKYSESIEQQVFVLGHVAAALDFISLVKGHNKKGRENKAFILKKRQNERISDAKSAKKGMVPLGKMQVGEEIIRYFFLSFGFLFVSQLYF